MDIISKMRSRDNDARRVSREREREMESGIGRELCVLSDTDTHTDSYRERLRKRLRSK